MYYLRKEPYEITLPAIEKTDDTVIPERKVTPRYIDVDKAVESIRLIYCRDCNSYNGVRCRACEFDDAMSAIEDVPAADVAPKSKVAQEIFAKIGALVRKHLNDAGYIFGDFVYDVIELEKKYTEEQ